MRPGALLRGLLLAPVLAAPALAPASDVQYVPTPMNVVDAILDLARVGPDDYLIDLGSGDGRIPIRAASRFGTRGHGMDIENHLVRMAREQAQKQGVADRVGFDARDLFSADLGRATVVTAYLLPAVNLRLRPQLFRQLKPGTRVVSHDFDFGDWKPDAALKVDVPDKPYGPPYSTIMVWVVPADFSGTWRWTAPGEEAHEIAVSQTFQKAEAAGSIAGRRAQVIVEIAGADIRLVMAGDTAGKAQRREFRGRINGDTIAGTAESLMEAGNPAMQPSRIPWRAERIRRGSMNIGEPQFGSGSINQERK